jgi:hypothetical protein
MDASIAGIIGALIGSISAITATYLTNRHAIKSERNRWILSKKEEAYTQSIRSLLEVMNSRSEITAEGKTILRSKNVKDWLTHCIDAIFWTRQISLYSSKYYKAHRLDENLIRFQNTIEKLTIGNARLLTEGIVSEPAVVRTDKDGTGLSFVSAYAESLLLVVTEAARRDIGI